MAHRPLLHQESIHWDRYLKNMKRATVAATQARMRAKITVTICTLGFKVEGRDEQEWGEGMRRARR
jgi:hypothetical protein